MPWLLPKRFGFRFRGDRITLLVDGNVPSLPFVQASLEELGQLADPVMTKDAVAGRIRRLLAMADKRAQDTGVP